MGTSSTKRTSDPDKITVRSFKITQGKLDRLAAVAAANERTVSQQVRWLIEQSVKDFESERPVQNAEAA